MCMCVCVPPCTYVLEGSERSFGELWGEHESSCYVSVGQRGSLEALRRGAQ